MFQALISCILFAAQAQADDVTLELLPSSISLNRLNAQHSLVLEGAESSRFPRSRSIPTGASPLTSTWSPRDSRRSRRSSLARRWW